MEQNVKKKIYSFRLIKKVKLVTKLCLAFLG